MAVMDGLRRDISDFVYRAAAAALETTYQETNKAAPERSGALRQTIGTTGPVMQGDFIATAAIFCAAPYAEWTDGGSVAHDIVATRPHGMLVWDGPGGTVFVSGKGGAPAVVRNPGSRGTHWFNSSIEGGEPMASRWEQALTLAAQ